MNLWSTSDVSIWSASLGRYGAVIAAQGVARLPERDVWYRDQLPVVLATRQPMFATLDEMVQVTEWKMARGVWRQRNLILVRSNAVATVESTSRDAFARMPDPARPIAALSALSGVGPATASALLSAANPTVYPFFDDLVADQVPDLGKVDYTPRYYARYADALRERAIALGAPWTPTLVERALWSNAGGKAGIVPS
jgi:hypothetical protein